MTELLSWQEIHDADAAGIRVAVIDSGVDLAHPELTGGNVRAFRVEQPWADTPIRRVTECAMAEDRLGHGTAVTTIVRRFAPAASVDSVQIFGLGSSSSANALTALRWAIDQGYAVINCSFGTPDRRALAEFKELVDLAFCRSVVIVAASNNDDFRLPEMPSAFPSVVSTGWGEFSGMAFSRRAGELVEFTAAGQRLRVAWKGGGYRDGMCGSSFAAPHMSALCARIKQLRPSWNAVEVKACLYNLARTEMRVALAGHGTSPTH